MLVYCPVFYGDVCLSTYPAEWDQGPLQRGARQLRVVVVVVGAIKSRCTLESLYLNKTDRAGFQNEPSR